MPFDTPNNSIPLLRLPFRYSSNSREEVPWSQILELSLPFFQYIMEFLELDRSFLHRIGIFIEAKECPYPVLVLLQVLRLQHDLWMRILLRVQGHDLLLLQGNGHKARLVMQRQGEPQRTVGTVHSIVHGHPAPDVRSYPPKLHVEPVGHIDNELHDTRRRRADAPVIAYRPVVWVLGPDVPAAAREHRKRIEPILLKILAYLDNLRPEGRFRDVHNVKVEQDEPVLLTGGRGDIEKGHQPLRESAQAGLLEPALPFHEVHYLLLVTDDNRLTALGMPPREIAYRRGPTRVRKKSRPLRIAHKGQPVTHAHLKNER